MFRHKNLGEGIEFTIFFLYSHLKLKKANILDVMMRNAMTSLFHSFEQEDDALVSGRSVSFFEKGFNSSVQGKFRVGFIQSLIRSLGAEMFG